MIEELCCLESKKPASKLKSLQEAGKGIQTLVKYAIKVKQLPQTITVKISKFWVGYNIKISKLLVGLS